MLTLEQFNKFVNQLNMHDWHYDYSDDHSVWKQGSNQLALIADSRKKHPMCEAAYQAFHTYVYRSHGTAAAREQRDQIINELRAELLITA